MAFRFPQRLSAFQEIRENLFMARSIQKIAIRASYFYATRSPSFVITAKQYLRLTQQVDPLVAQANS